MTSRPLLVVRERDDNRGYMYGVDLECGHSQRLTIVRIDSIGHLTWFDHPAEARRVWRQDP